MALKAHRIGDHPKSATTSVYTHVVHHVEVDLTSLLAGFDPTEQVVLVIRTPSGRPKRVTIPGGFLVSPMPEHDPFA